MEYGHHEFRVVNKCRRNIEGILMQKPLQKVLRSFITEEMVGDNIKTKIK